MTRKKWRRKRMKRTGKNEKGGCTLETLLKTRSPSCPFPALFWVDVDTTFFSLNNTHNCNVVTKLPKGPWEGIFSTNFMCLSTKAPAIRLDDMQQYYFTFLHCYTLFENYSKCRIWIFDILAFFTNFCPIKNVLSGNIVWPQLQISKSR